MSTTAEDLIDADPPIFKILVFVPKSEQQSPADKKHVAERKEQGYSQNRNQLLRSNNSVVQDSQKGC